MKFSCEKNVLLSAVSTTSRAVSPKSAIPALEGILVEAGGKLSLTGYNLETGIRVNVAADITERGSLVLSARLFGEIIRKMPDDIVYFDAKGYSVNLRCGQSEFNILATDAEDFPELPSVDQENSVTLGQEQLRSMISQTLFAVSDNESRPIHTGSLFEVGDDNRLVMVSVDGFRLAVRREELKACGGLVPFSFVVPGAALSEVERICSGDDDVVVVQGARHIMFVIGETLLVCRRLEGEFLPYRNAIPQNNAIVIQGDCASLLRAFERVSLIISEKLKSPVRCVFGDGILSLTSKTGLGDAADQCAVTGDGKDLEIGFNNKYMMDAIKNAPADRLQIELSSAVAPCVIRPTDGSDRFTYMVLPVRLKAN